MKPGSIEPIVLILPTMGYWIAWARAIHEKKDKYRSVALTFDPLNARRDCSGFNVC